MTGVQTCALPIFNTGRYWLIKLSRGQSTFFGLYDISDRDLKIAETTSGFLDGFMGPMKTDFTKTSNSGEICIFLQPNEILEWFEKNPEKMKNAPPERQKLLTIRPSDNPVVVIAKIRQ